MARLNEPPVSTDSFDILRRKFVRQNREIVKINSNQSQRIRELENDCARMLSENLELRTQVFHLQKELESNSAQRIADHALQVKAKMEAQLEELSSLLSGLGVEPPTKRHSPSSRKISHAKPGLSRSPRQRRPRNTPSESEAAQDGRLPSIPEHKIYPRPTLNEEIQAICSEAVDSADSPILGPPPVSRFVDEDQVKVDSPRRTADNEMNSEIGQFTEIPETTASPPKLDFNKKPALTRETKQATETLEPVKVGKATREAGPSIALQTPAAGSKRKFGDENAVLKVANSPEKPTPVEPGTEKPRSIKALSASCRTLKQKKTQGPGSVTGNPRRALAAKSTNEDVASPKKLARQVSLEPTKPDKPQNMKDDIQREQPTRRRAPGTLKIPELPAAPPSVVTISAPEIPSPDTPMTIPDTPDHSAPRGFTRDTPPPSDISSMGETARPSRRVRASISYAEPNLRDKMRRPTKELVDAVTGEGKYIHKSGQQRPDDQGITSGPTPSAESQTSTSWKSPSAAEAVAMESARRQSIMSPLAAKEASTADSLPSSILTERGRRASSVGARKSLAQMERLEEKSRTSSRDSEVPMPASHSTDVYDFTTSSPLSEKQDSSHVDDRDAGTITVREPLRKPRRSSAAAKDISSRLDTFSTGKGPKATTSRKRASMAAPTNGSMTQAEDVEESMGDDEGPLARGRISRRRSMML